MIFRVIVIIQSYMSTHVHCNKPEIYQGPSQLLLVPVKNCMITKATRADLRSSPCSEVAMTATTQLSRRHCVLDNQEHGGLLEPHGWVLADAGRLFNRKSSAQILFARSEEKCLSF